MIPYDRLTLVERILCQTCLVGEVEDSKGNLHNGLQFEVDMESMLTEKLQVQNAKL